ncbi:MAG TPA: hypothetical protein H9870_12605 [Candidatus Corynebacterium avicola]|uniref:Uncharacterized protein n=1 Tax=Candidatus Corynebacterium avicola TaxID=2838527 RepID=A0A9D1RRM5_9CORY|nr:hypothetical protein [Candidatus Corynebacterium avicola]
MHDNGTGQVEDGSEKAKTPTAVTPEMTFGEMREAFEDVDHPRHSEALQWNKDLSARLSPAMDELRKSVTEPLGLSQLAGNMTAHVAAGLRGSAAPMVADLVKSAQPIISSADVPSGIGHISVPETRTQRLHAADTREFNEGLAEAARERKAREQRQDKISDASLEALQALVADTQRLNQQIGNVDQRLLESNRSADSSFRWTIGIASLTLAATVTSLVIAIFF